VNFDALWGNGSIGSNDVLRRGGADWPTGRGNLGGRYGATHHNQWGICGVAV